MTFPSYLISDLGDGDGYPQGSGMDSLTSSCPMATMSAPPGLFSPLLSGFPSRGSVLHDEGHCKPCAWFWKPGGCQNGRECLHCHLCPKDAKASRKKIKAALRRSVESHIKTDSAENDFALAYPHFDNETSILANSSPESEWLGVSSGLHLEGVPTFCSTLSMECDLDVDSRPVPLALGLPADGTSVSLPGLPLSSRGAELHAFGQCKPCGWFWKPGGCSNGQDCNHCHSCPEGALKARKKAKKVCLQ